MKETKKDICGQTWLANTSDVREFREKILKENNNICEMSGESIKRACLDHDHFNGATRGVVSQHFNTYEGRVLKYWKKYCERYTDLTLSQFLRRLADYYEKDWSDRPLHYRVIQDHRKQLKYCNKNTIIIKLKKDFNIEAKNTLTKDKLIKLYCDNLKIYLEHSMKGL